jgi:ZIP family zinc transporter
MVLTAADLAGVVLIAAATLAGAWLGRRFARLRSISLACAAMALIAVVGADLAPDIWNDVRETGLPWWIAAAGLAAGLATTDAVVRRGCACGPGRKVAAGEGATDSEGATAGGAAAAVSLGVHRALEGAALAIAGSAAVITALVAHAASEGFALTVLLRGERRGRAAVLLVITCLSPAAGAVVLALIHLPESVVPVLTSVVAGVLLRAALAAWQVGRRVIPAGRRRSAKCWARTSRLLTHPSWSARCAR